MPGAVETDGMSGSLKASKFNPNKQHTNDAWTRRLKSRLHEADPTWLKAKVGIATLTK